MMRLDEACSVQGAGLHRRPNLSGLRSQVSVARSAHLALRVFTWAHQFAPFILAIVRSWSSKVRGDENRASRDEFGVGFET